MLRLTGRDEAIRRCAVRLPRLLEDLMEDLMALWTAPIVEETPVGLEVTSYSPAEL